MECLELDLHAKRQQPRLIIAVDLEPDTHSRSHKRKKTASMRDGDKPHADDPNYRGGQPRLLVQSAAIYTFRLDKRNGLAKHQRTQPASVRRIATVVNDNIKSLRSSERQYVLLKIA